jgi:DNA helicase II / ATP-dependent DNA helicase PcrA
MPLSRLNADQLSAATASRGHNLVIASAGTGKTSTIVGRIAHLLCQGADPSKILLLTFTNKAAGEMIARLGAHFPSQIVSQIEAGTFHAVSYRWLRAHDPHIALKQPGELRTLFRSIYEKRDFKRLGIEEAFSAHYLYERYNLYQNASIEGFDAWFLAAYPEHEPLMDIYQHIIEEFEEVKKAYGFVSFNDLLLHTRKILTEHKRTLEEVLVDEYQDTNTLQNSLIETLDPSSLFCVGDYDQSIYAFNGADINHIATFSKRHPDARVFTLKTNYRSTAPILSLANRVIERNPRIYPKTLEVGRTGAAQAPSLLVYHELFEQYQSIAHAIRNSPTSQEQIAVIFRNNASADGIEASLRELGVSCKRKGGTSFFESREVKFLLDLMTLLVNPKDMMAFIHIFEYAKGVGAALAKEFFISLGHFGGGDAIAGVRAPRHYDLPRLNPIKNVQLGLFDDDREIGSISRFASLSLSETIRSHPLLKHPKLSQEGLMFFIAFHDFLHSIRQSRTPATLLKKAIDSSLYATAIQHLSEQRARTKTGEVDEKKRLESAERIRRKADLLLELAGHYKDLNRFVNAMVLGGSELSEGEGVNLLTVHASKGLEFRDVYVVDLMDGRFPNRKLMGKGGSLEEERRLFYVAVTRAQERLCLSFAKSDRIRQLEFIPSPFLYEAGLIDGEFPVQSG